MAVSTVPDPNKPKNPISANQNSYLTNMAAGKTSTGGAASAGQSTWAKSQLANSSYTPVPAPNPPKPTVTTTPQSAPNNVMGSGGAVPSPNAVSKPSSGINPDEYATWKSKTDANYNNLQSLMGGSFEYNPATDPRYQAFQTLAKQRAGVASQSAMESMNDRGILNSSVTGSQLAQIQQGAEQEALAAIPQFYDQARSDYQNKIQNASQLLNFSTGRIDSDRDYGLNVADRTGYITPDGSDELRSRLLALKGQAEAKGTTPEQRKGLSQQADAIRSQLQGMGVDISGVGANVNQANASTVNFGTRTLAGQNQDYNQQSDTRNYNRDVKVDDRNYNRGVVESDRGFNEDVRQFDEGMQYTAGRDKVQDAQWMKQFDEQVKQNGIGNALNWAQNAISQQNANTSANNSRIDNALNREKFDYQKGQDKISNELAANKSSGNSNISAKDSANNMTQAKTYISNLSDEDAIAYIQGISDYLSDADYRAMLGAYQ